MTVRAPASNPGWLAQLRGVRFFGVLWGSLLAVDLGRLVSTSAWPPTLLVAATVCLCSLGQRPVLAVAAGLTGWLIVTGFVANGDGALVLTGAPDVARLVLLLGSAGLGAVLPRTLTRS